MDYSEQIRGTQTSRPRSEQAVSVHVEDVSLPAEQAITHTVERGDRDNLAEREPEEQAMARENYLDGGGGRSINWAFLLTGVLALLVSGAFGYYYWQSTN